MDGKAGSSIGDLIAKQGSALEIIGAFEAVDSQTFVYASKWASYLIWFDQKGTTKRIVQTFEKRPFPGETNLTSDQGAKGYKAPDQSEKTWDMAENNGVLWVSTIFKGASDYTIFDAYDAMKGTYIASQKVNKKLTGFDVMDDTIFAASDTVVVKIDVSKLPSF